MHELELGGTLAGGKVSESQWDSMVEKTSASAFKVVVSDCAGQPIATGSGFDIGQYVVTNRHVVEDAGRIKLVGPDGAETDVSRWAIGLSDDLALLVPEKPPSKSVVHLASKDPVSGDLVASVGFPLGGKLTTRKARVLQRVAHPSLSSTFVLSTTASVSPGDSGGVLVDSKGDVVAVTTAVALKDDVTLAIPVSRVLDLIDRVPPFHASPICG